MHPTDSAEPIEDSCGHLHDHDVHRNRSGSGFGMGNATRRFLLDLGYSAGGGRAVVSRGLSVADDRALGSMAK